VTSADRRRRPASTRPTSSKKTTQLRFLQRFGLDCRHG
jgi:hypothetical protein